MVEWVLCLEPDSTQPSSEFALGVLQLHEVVGRSARWVYADAVQGGGLAQGLARLLAQTAHQPDSDVVLVLAHLHIQFHQDVLQRLVAGVGGTAHGAWDAALCWGTHRVPAGFSPDYCTARGLERYGQAMASAVAQEACAWDRLELPDGCQVAVASLGSLRRLFGGGVLRAAWLPGCFAHDFAHYHQGQRAEVLPLVPLHARRVLDVGGGEGHFLALLGAERGCETHLSEYSSAVCALAQQRVDVAWPGDFLALDAAEVAARAGVPSGGGVFDCITFLDSLEHAVEPGLWLDKAHGLLHDGGCVVGSIPNVGHWSVLADLLEGRWDYCPVGIHCSTHLRFFTRKTITDLLCRHGFALEAMEPVLVPAPAHWRSHWLSTPGLVTQSAELDAYAFLFRAKKTGRG